MLELTMTIARAVNRAGRSMDCALWRARPGPGEPPVRVICPGTGPARDPCDLLGDA